MEYEQKKERGLPPPQNSTSNNQATMFNENDLISNWILKIKPSTQVISFSRLQNILLLQCSVNTARYHSTLRGSLAWVCSLLLNEDTCFIILLHKNFRLERCHGMLNIELFPDQSGPRR